MNTTKVEYTEGMKIGVFDSGIGGEAVAAAMRDAFPDAEVITVNDRKHVPYGLRQPKEIIRLTNRAIQPLLKQQCDVIILACNTATAVAIEDLRERYPDQKFVGLEPMVKPAADQTETGIICICATPTTLSSERYQSLKDRFAEGLQIIEPDCSNWASMIEESSLDELQITNTINDACSQGADVIVLACTHYHWIRTIIEETAADRAIVLDPSEAIARRVRNLLTPA